MKKTYPRRNMISRDNSHMYSQPEKVKNFCELPNGPEFAEAEQERLLREYDRTYEKLKDIEKRLHDLGIQ